ncbi:MULTISPECIES: HD-GYP domain-containing protein [Geobacter]|uniref:HD-GYP domain-containing protein n=1 Tax=Geobacter TaxID=28231 RepID=UPI0025746311|nr:HD domain-containing phosphohydrolase [Geobacter sulfurreducens]BEH09230.1 HD domain-containing protein [Geobacter sulfurreducens subsp. ethanolicus]BET57114.1 HD domain-containing protein [Geobacter sp. 60473]
MNEATRQRLLGALRSLVTAISGAALYAARHPRVTLLRSEAFAELSAALEAEESLSLVVIDGEILVEGAPLDGGLFLQRLAGMLTSRGIGHLKFLRGVTEEELAALASILAGSGTAGGQFHSSPHVRFGRVEVRYSGGTDGTGHASGLPGMEIGRFMELYEGVVRHRRSHVTGLADLVAGFITVLREQSGPLAALAPLRGVDEYTFTHSVNVCVLNLAQAMALGIDGPLLQEIGIAGMLHDIGKMFVPPEILTKPGQLDDDEWAVMRRHPLMGARCLAETPGVPRLAVVATFEHHLKHDLSGYPSVAAGWRQSLCSGMTTLSDFFDALRTRRAYRDSMELRQIAGLLLEKRGREFHPLLTRNFLLVLSRLAA